MKYFKIYKVIAISKKPYISFQNSNKTFQSVLIALDVDRIIVSKQY